MAETITSTLVYEVGDRIKLSTPEDRWWMLFWAGLTGQRHPMRLRYARVEETYLGKDGLNYYRVVYEKG